MIYYISVGENNSKASGKARLDIERVFKRLGFEQFKEASYTDKYIKIQKLRHIREFLIAENRWAKIIKGMQKNDVLIIQHPMSSSITVYRAIKGLKKKGAHIVLIIHDLYSLREKQNLNNPYYRLRDFSLLSFCDVIISHNEHMTNVLASYGIDRKKIVNLELFDYIYPSKVSRTFTEEDKHSIVIAGNLDRSKAGYLYELGKILNKTNLYLYGRNFDEFAVAKNGKTIYKGELLADELPQKIHTGFGLVWDGTSVDECNGNTGEYLKINNPHKTSCNLASGLPLIVWSKSAMADVVKKYGVGICVDSLRDIDCLLGKISNEQFIKITENVEALSEKIRSGYFTERAIKKALLLLENMNALSNS